MKMRETIRQTIGDYTRKYRERKKQKLTRRQICALLFLAAAAAAVIAICFWFCRPMLQLADRPAEFRAYIESRGMVGIGAFLLATMLQVIAAVIPGGPFEIAAGYTFGLWKGSLLSDLGTTAGSLIVFLLVRRFGREFVELFFPKEKIDSLSFLKTTNRSRWIIFLLFLIPGTPKDMLSYFVGLTDMPLPVWLFITAVGRFPSIFLSALSGTALGRQDYLSAILLIGGIVLLCGAGAVGYQIYLSRKNRTEEKEDTRNS